jgi:hypothetical protein
LCVHTNLPVVASYARTCPCTNGTSQFDEIPTITFPFATVGLDHAYTSFAVVDGTCTSDRQIVDPSLPLSLYRYPSGEWKYSIGCPDPSSWTFTLDTIPNGMLHVSFG